MKKLPTIDQLKKINESLESNYDDIFQLFASKIGIYNKKTAKDNIKKLKSAGVKLDDIKNNIKNLVDVWVHRSFSYNKYEPNGYVFPGNQYYISQDGLDDEEKEIMDYISGLWNQVNESLSVDDIRGEIRKITSKLTSSNYDATHEKIKNLLRENGFEYKSSDGTIGLKASHWDIWKRGNETIKVTTGSNAAGNAYISA